MNLLRFPSDKGQSELEIHFFKIVSFSLVLNTDIVFYNILLFSYKYISFNFNLKSTLVEEIYCLRIPVMIF